MFEGGTFDDFKGAHLIEIHCLKGAHLRILQKHHIVFSRGTFDSNALILGAHFNPKKRKVATKVHMLPVKCAHSNSYVPPTMVVTLYNWGLIVLT